MQLITLVCVSIHDRVTAIPRLGRSYSHLNSFPLDTDISQTQAYRAAERRAFLPSFSLRIPVAKTDRLDFFSSRLGINMVPPTWHVKGSIPHGRYYIGCGDTNRVISNPSDHMQKIL